MFPQVILPSRSLSFFIKILFCSLLVIIPLFPRPGDAQTTPDFIILEKDKPIEREISGDQKHNYQIKLSANQYVKVIIEQREIDVIARLQSAEGKIITDNNADPRIVGQETIEFTTKETAVFTILVWAKQNNAASGHYEVRVEELRPANDKDYLLDEARQLNFQAETLWRAGKYNEAEPLSKRSLAIREKELGVNNLDFAASLMTLGNIIGDNGDYAACESLYLRALAIRERLLGKDDIAVSIILNNLGILYKDEGNYPAAESALRRALEIRQKNLEPNHLLIANTLNNLAVINDRKGDMLKAAEYYRRALEIREKALPPDSPDIAQSLNNLANLSLDVATAEPLHLRALAIREKVYGPDSPFVADTLYNLARLYTEAGDYAKAEPLAQRTLAIFEKSYGAAHPRTGYTLNLLAAIYKNSGDYLQSESMFQRAIEILEKIQGVNHPDLSSMYSNFADLYTFKGDLDKAILMDTHANDILEFNVELNIRIGSEQQKSDYLKTFDQYINHTVGFNFQYAPDSQTATNLGAEMILRQKGRVLDAMADNIGALRRRFNAQDQLLLDNLDKINKDFSEFILNGTEKITAAEYQVKIKKLTDERDDLEDKISRRAAGFYEKTKPVTLSAVQQLIPADAALLEFTIYEAVTGKPQPNKAKPIVEPHYAAYILQNQKAAKGIDLGNAAQIDQAIDAFRQALRDPQRKDTAQLAKAVDEKIIEPVRALLGDAKQLFVSPDGELNSIPFEALVDEQGHYLVENYQVTYLTSGRDLMRMKVKRDSQSTSLIIANPQFGSPPAAQSAAGNKTRNATVGKPKVQSVTATRSLSDTYFAPIGGTAQEARSIKTLFPDATLLSGAQATETTLKQTNAPTILHIATHGFFLEDSDAKSSAADSNTAKRAATADGNRENPLLRSGLAFAGANQHGSSGDDGILTALEASGLNLWGTKLVVLSACDTGLGEIKNGEGVYGLHRSFVLAGTESLVMSLWSVSDYVTRELMTGYYKNLKQGMGRGVALREVQLEMMKRKGREHPFYWAAFIQSGEWANLDGSR